MAEEKEDGALKSGSTGHGGVACLKQAADGEAELQHPAVQHDKYFFGVAAAPAAADGKFEGKLEIAERPYSADCAKELLLRHDLLKFAGLLGT
jgi:hypothetical protein